ncbi:hypothetical protein Tco_0219920, partial [Tanacetum coccineum]
SAARRGTKNPPWVMVSLAVEESSGHRFRPFRHQPGYLVKKRKTIRGNLFVVTLWKVDNEAADRRQRDHGTNTGMP